MYCIGYDILKCQFHFLILSFNTREYVLQKHITEGDMNIFASFALPCLHSISLPGYKKEDINRGMAAT